MSNIEITEEIKKALGGNERVYCKLPEGESKSVFIEYSEGVAHTVKPWFIKIFGMSFLSAEAVRCGNLIKRTFDADKKDIEVCAQLFSKLTNDSIIKSIPDSNN